MKPKWLLFFFKLIYYCKIKLTIFNSKSRNWLLFTSSMIFPCVIDQTKTRFSTNSIPSKHRKKYKNYTLMLDTLYNLLDVQYCIITHKFLLHNHHLQYKPWVVSLCIPFVWISISHIFSILFFRLLGYYKGQCTILKKSTIQPNVENEIYLVHWPKLAQAP